LVLLKILTYFVSMKMTDKFKNKKMDQNILNKINTCDKIIIHDCLINPKTGKRFCYNYIMKIFMGIRKSEVVERFTKKYLKNKEKLRKMGSSMTLKEKKKEPRKFDRQKRPL
jgi:hypothetical protein